MSAATRPTLEKAVEANREAGFLLAWIRPDHLTALGVLAALGVCGAYALSGNDPAWLWVAAPCSSSSGSGTASTGPWRGCAVDRLSRSEFRLP